jgi:hypothetical protein|tara:strand:- start:291 stop:473 length:183 start_codon:yes stop_codon:yes gene_type:complete
MKVLSEYMQPDTAGFDIRIEHDEVKNLWEVMFQDKSVGVYQTQGEAATRADYFRENYSVE